MASSIAGDEKLRRELQRYDTRHSPFLELQTPFTTWYAAPIELQRLAWTLLACLNLATNWQGGSQDGGPDMDGAVPPGAGRGLDGGSGHPQLCGSLQSVRS